MACDTCGLQSQLTFGGASEDGAIASGGEYHGGSVVKFHPAKTMVGAARFDFPTPVKDTILAQSHVSAMAPTDIKKHLGVDALRTSRRTCIGKNGRIKAVVWVDTAEVDLFSRRFCFLFSVTLGGAYATPYCKFSSADATRAVAKIKTGYPILVGAMKRSHHVCWCGDCSSAKTRVPVFQSLGHVPVPLAWVFR